MAAGAADVIAAVHFARERGLGAGVLATDHGVASPCDDGILINTSGMRGVRIDPEARTARVEPGALWRDVVPEAQAFGLAGCRAPLPVQPQHTAVLGAMVNTPDLSPLY
jgi:FAD/FMN-containing dehydrogenase